MARPRSLIVSIALTQAGRAHDCRHNKNHRVEKGDQRLTIKSDGDEHHYCLRCARIFLIADIERLNALLKKLSAEDASVDATVDPEDAKAEFAPPRPA